MLGMTPLKKNVNQATTVASAAPEGNGKTIGVTKPTDRRPNYPTSISPMLNILNQITHRWRMQVAEPKSQLNSEQLLLFGKETRGSVIEVLPAYKIQNFRTLK